MEFGSNALSREESWFTVLIEFNTWIKLMHAGISQVFKQVIKQFFLKSGFNFATNGVLLEFEDGDIRLWAVVGGILQDGWWGPQVRLPSQGGWCLQILRTVQEFIYRSVQRGRLGWDQYVAL